MERKVIITDCDHIDLKQEDEVFRKNNVEYEFLDCNDTDELIQKLKGVEVIANQYTPLTEKFFNEVEDLKLVVRYGVGVNHIDIDAATKNNVIVCNVPDYGIQEVACQALAMLLALSRKLVLANTAMKNGRWSYEECIPMYRFSTQTVGIIGMGRIGTCLANMLKGFNCRVIATDIDEKRDIPDHVEMVTLDQLLRESDMISVHSPLETSKNLIDEAELKKMKKNAYIVNVARGSIINEDALIKALKKDWIAGAGLDVFEKEPLAKNHPLLAFDNFVCSPHMAWYSEQASVDLKRKLAEELVRYINGEPLKYRLN